MIDVSILHKNKLGASKLLLRLTIMTFPYLQLETYWEGAFHISSARYEPPQALTLIWYLLVSCLYYYM